MTFAVDRIELCLADLIATTDAFQSTKLKSWSCSVSVLDIAINRTTRLNDIIEETVIKPTDHAWCYLFIE